MKLETTSARRQVRGVRLLCFVLLPALAAGCASDPRQEILDERARWDVTLIGWAPKGDGIQAQLRVSGPVQSRLGTLTVQLLLLDETDEPVGEFWAPLDVSGVERGTPTEMFVGIPGEHAGVHGLVAQLVLDPTPEQERKIPELSGGS